MSEFVEPVGKRVLVRKDESRQKTRGGIVLPDAAEIPTITGRVVEVSVQVAHDEDFPIRKYDKILFFIRRTPFRSILNRTICYSLSRSKMSWLCSGRHAKRDPQADRRTNRWATTRFRRLTGWNRIEDGG